MKITLIFPPSIYQTKQKMPPLGIAFLAAVLRENGFKNVSIIDSMAYDYTLEQIVDLLKKDPPDIVGISFGTQIRFSAFNLARLIKKSFPKIIIVAGGPHPTLTPEDTLKHIPQIDVIVRGEGEISFLNLVKAIEAKSDLKDVKGISFRDKKKNIVHSPPEEPIKDLDALPLPARDLMPIEAYNQKTYRSKTRCINMITSRGCPYHCVYCSTSTQWGHNIRHRSPENVVNEMEYILKTYPFIKGFRFFDDVFTMDKQRVLDICNLIIERGLNVAWECEVRANTVNQEIMVAMRKAGCEFVDLGIESGSNQILKNIRKAITVDMAIKAVTIIKQAGIDLKGFLMHALPGETYQDIKKTVFLSRYLLYKLKIDGTTQSIAVIYPGTELEKIAKELGTLPQNFSWAKYWERKESYPPLSPCIHMPIFEQPNLSYKQVFHYVRRAKIVYYLTHPQYIFTTLVKHRTTIKKWLKTKT